MPEESITLILSTFILLPLLNAIPFVVLACLAKSFIERSSPENYIQRKSSVIGTGIAVFGITLFIDIAIATSSSSTASMAFLFLPIYGSAIIPIGYLCGKIVGSLIVKKS